MESCFCHVRIDIISYNYEYFNVFQEFRNYSWLDIFFVTVVCCPSSLRYFPVVETVLTWSPSQLARWRLKSPILRLFTQPFIQPLMNENIKAPRHWPLWGELNSPHKGTVARKMFPFDDVITSRITDERWTLVCLLFHSGMLVFMYASCLYSSMFECGLPRSGSFIPCSL